LLSPLRPELGSPRKLQRVKEVWQEEEANPSDRVGDGRLCWRGVVSCNQVEDPCSGRGAGSHQVIPGTQRQVGVVGKGSSYW